MCQVTRSHYQNAVMATRMDTSPQTPDADAHLTEGDGPSPEASEDSAPQSAATLAPPPRKPGRPSSARSRGQPSSVHSTSLLNEKNRIVRECPQIHQEVMSRSCDLCWLQEVSLTARRVAETTSS